jgi:hypothetical protein
MLMWSEMFAPDGELDIAAAGKLCFASDCTYFIKDYFEFEKFISFYQRFFDRVKMPESLREKINSGNCMQLFK